MTHLVQVGHRNFGEEWFLSNSSTSIAPFKVFLFFFLQHPYLLGGLGVHFLRLKYGIIEPLQLRLPLLLPPNIPHHQYANNDTDEHRYPDRNTNVQTDVGGALPIAGWSGAITWGRQAVQAEARRRAGRAIRGPSVQGVGIAERRRGGAGDGCEAPCIGLCLSDGGNCKVNQQTAQSKGNDDDLIR